MSSTATRDALLLKLQANEKINSQRLKTGGFLGETRTHRCARCGLYETLLFWAPAGSSAGGRILHFRCPNGCATEVRFDPRSGEVDKSGRRSTVVLANWLLLSVLGLGLYAWSVNTVTGQAFVARAWETSQTRIYELGLVLPGR